MTVLPALIVLPALAAVVCWLLQDRPARWFAFAVSLIELALAALAVLPQLPLETKQAWMPAIGLAFDLRLTAGNALLLVLTPLLSCLAILTTGVRPPKRRALDARSPEPEIRGLKARLERLNEYCGHLLLLLASLQGLFLADNLGLFYIFFELMLIPTLVITARWGGDGGRKAALKFLLYTLAGSLPMLLGVISLAFQSGAPDLSFEALATLPIEIQQSLFWLFLLAFAVKVPLFPLHGWLTDLYGTAPATTVAVVAGAMSKAGLYGMIRVLLGLFPDACAQYGGVLAIIALFTLLYGGLCALGAPTLRSILAFSSLSHLGLMVLAVFAGNRAGLDSAVLQMFSHGICTGGLFLVVGLLEMRGLPEELSNLGGLAQTMPRLTALFLVLAMGSLGCPGLCSFPAELGMLTGIALTNSGLAMMATIGVVLAAWYGLRLFQGCMNGPVRHPEMEDVSDPERWALFTLAALAFWVGLMPGFWLNLARVFPWN